MYSELKREPLRRHLANSKSEAASLRGALAYARGTRQRFEGELGTFIRFASVSAQRQHWSRHAELEVLDQLLAMLAYRRPSGSQTELEFCQRYIEPLGAYRDPAGNYIVAVGSSRVLYSCHYDTVHRQGGLQGVQAIKGIVSLDDPLSNCLGADDTVGVWLMRQMILNQVPGLYIFHAAEEIGGVGSQYIVDHTPEFLRNIDAAMGFDRRGTGDVITHQNRRRTSSDAFARSLAHLLSEHGSLAYGPSSNGRFTDTANYAHLIPECSNVSVGYLDEHTPNETLDLIHAANLRCRLIHGFDEARLVIKRDPSVEERGDIQGPRATVGFLPKAVIR